MPHSTLQNPMVMTSPHGTQQGGQRLHSVPGHAGHLFLCSGITPLANAYAGVLHYCTNGNNGASWINSGLGITGVYAVEDVGFGAIAPGNDYPTIFIVGWVGGYDSAHYGVWRSTNSAAQWAANTVTWTRCGSTPYPRGFYGEIMSVAGDMDTFGTVYIAMQGYGWAVGKLS